MQAPGRRSRRLAAGVRVAASRQGTLLVSATRSIRVKEDGFSFVFDVLPMLEGDAKEGPSPWLADLCERLEAAGMVQVGAGEAPRSRTHPTVVAGRETPLVAEVRAELGRRGIALKESGQEGALVLTDHSGLDSRASADLIKGLHDRRRGTFSVWRRGGETLFGPWTQPGRTACWHCCRLRFADTLALENGGEVDPDPATVRVVAESLALAIAHPDRTPMGCVVSDLGESATLHMVVPMPWCEVCGGAAGLVALDSRAVTSSEHVRDELRVLADPRGGVVRALRLFDGGRSDDAPELPAAASALIGRYAGEPFPRPEFAGEGKGATLDDAVTSAIGEAVERYSAALWGPETLVRASFDELGSSAFDPRALVLYEEDRYREPGFAYVPFDPTKPLAWTEGRWLDDDQAVQLPALATYMHFPAEPGERFAQTTSNGLAAGVGFEDAALRAFYELIERDAFMLYWLAGRPALRIQGDGADPLVRRARDEVERLGARTELFVLDSGIGVPTVVCLGLGDGRSWPGVTIGLAAGARLTSAVRGAVLEHGHCGSYIRRLMLEGRHEQLRSPEQVVSGLDHALYYVDPARAQAVEPLRSGLETATVEELCSRYDAEPTLADCVSRLRAAGIRAAAADVTSPDIALSPLRVVRAFGTYLQPIHFGFQNARLQNPRLAALLSGGQAVSEPHPLA